jgi:hypothetical protein
MSGLILTQLVTTANYEMRMAIDRLQVEESGRDVASDQGKVAGWKELIGNLSAAFHLEQYFLEDNGEDPVKIPDLSDGELETYRLDADMIRNTEEWTAVIARIQDNIDMLKSHLLFTAEKTRDLDIDQGKYQAQMIYRNIFDAIDYEIKRREAKAQEDEEAMPLFSEDGPAGDPGLYEEDHDHEGIEPQLEEEDSLAIADRVLDFSKA